MSILISVVLVAAIVISTVFLWLSVAIFGHLIEEWPKESHHRTAVHHAVGSAIVAIGAYALVIIYLIIWK